jgi:hypothetical protein
MSNLAKIDIITLIEKDSKTRLSRDYENTLINKIKDSFTAEEQQLFVASFYCYLNYDSKRDFVIDFTDVWKWCGFTRKEEGKRLLKNHFVLDLDYKIENFAPPIGGAKNVEEDEKISSETRGGYNKEKITLTVHAFKKFCMKAGTKKADQIHDYYIKLEELLQETLKEQTDELQKQLQYNKTLLEKKDEHIRKLQRSRQVVKGKNCVYLCTAEGKEEQGIYTVGQATDIERRLHDYNSNKLFNFKIVKYISCKSIRLMDAIETILLAKLNKYKIVNNRDVFQLPEGKDVSFFTQWYDYVAKLCEDIEDNIELEERTDEEKQKILEERKKDKNKETQEYNKEYQKENKEKITKQRKEYRTQNHGKILEKKKEYYEENKEKILEKNKEYREEKKDEIKEKKKIYRQENKSKRNEKITCTCGVEIIKSYKWLHVKTAKHLEKINTKPIEDTI